MTYSNQMSSRWLWSNCAQGNWKWNSEFYKKEELEENSIYSLKPIEDLKLRGIKKEVVWVLERVKFCHNSIESLGI